MVQSWRSSDMLLKAWGVGTPTTGGVWGERAEGMEAAVDPQQQKGQPPFLGAGFEAGALDADAVLARHGAEFLAVCRGLGRIRGRSVQHCNAAHARASRPSAVSKGTSRCSASAT